MRLMNNVGFAKTVLMLLVILGHSFLFWNESWGFCPVALHAPFLGHFAVWLNSFHIYAFVIISGYTYEFIIETRGGYHSFSALMKKKIRRLLLPYSLFSFLWVIPLTSLFIDMDFNYILNKFILGKSPAQLWFLLMLFGVFALFYPLRTLFDRNRLFYLLIPLLYSIGLAGSIYHNGDYDFFQFFTSLKYLAFFTMGHLLYKYRTFLFSNTKYSLSNVRIISLLLAINLITFFFYLKGIANLTAILYVFLNFEGSIMAVALLLSVGKRINQNNKYFRMLQDNSFVMYLLHQQIIYVTITVLNGLIWPFCHALINFAVAFTLSLIISIIIRKSVFVRVYCLGEKN